MATGLAETETEVETPEVTLEEATAAEKIRLEGMLCDRTEAVTEAQREFNRANDEAKECKKELEARESMLWQTNRDLRLVILGEWRPPKPDPQKELPFDDESDAFWESKPIEELGLSKNINRILENEGFMSIGPVVREIDEGQGFLNINELTEGHIAKIIKAVAEFRSKLDGVGA